MLDKGKWQEKWKKIKAFVKNKKGSRDEKADGILNQRDDIFNALLALYAGDDEEEVFADLNVLYERYP